MDERLRIILPATDGRPVITQNLAESLTAELNATMARYVTIEGPPGAFCEGLDLDRLADSRDDVRSAQHSYARMLRAVEHAPCPVFALVDGVALGGGLGLVAAADLVIATPRSEFGLPETLVGLIPAVALPYVAQRTGTVRARLLALDGGAIDAEAAQRVGLVDELTEDLEAACARHARRMMRMDGTAQSEVKAIAAAMGRPDADADALRRFADLYEMPTSRTRIARLAAGEPPWLDDSTETDT